jgi:hypothetical protein
VIPVGGVVVIIAIFFTTRYCFRRSRLSPEKTAKHILQHDQSVLSIELARANFAMGSQVLNTHVAQARREAPPPTYIQATARAPDL